MITVTSATTKTAAKAATPTGTEYGSAASRPAATQESPQLSDTAGLNRPLPPTASPMPTSAATAMTATPHTFGSMPQPSNPRSVSQAAVFAAVAMLTQPRYSPTTPSTTIASTQLEGRCAMQARNAIASTITSSAMTTTLSQSSPACTLKIQAPFNTSDAAIGYPSRRWRSDAR